MAATFSEKNMFHQKHESYICELPLKRVDWINARQKKVLQHQKWPFKKKRPKS